MDNLFVPEDLRDGSSDQFSVSIESVTLQNGFEISPPVGGVTVVVGGNNVGKSTLLRQMATLAARDPGAQADLGRWQLVTDIRFKMSGDARDCTAWLIAHENSFLHNGVLRFGVQGQSNMSEHSIRTLFRGQSQRIDRLGSMSNALTLSADPWQRAGSINPVDMRENVDTPPHHALHRLQDSLEMLTELREICRDVFRVDLTLDTLARMIQLRIGKVSSAPPPVDAVTAKYRSEIASLPPLMEQGDGMKSLIGLILPLVTAKQPIVFIDEPEAFLHPPQAGALGKILGELARKNGIQLILATHDKNLLAGILASSAQVSVVRLDRGREGDCRAHQLAVGDVRDLWNDPMLKYTNVLDSLFHRLTIIAEADQDCRFYGAALGEYEPRSDVVVPPSDVLFIPSYGKAAVHKLVRVLRAIFVPVVAVPDIDILNDEVNIARLVSAYGADWSGMRSDYRVATQPFRDARSTVTIGDVVRAVEAVFSGREDEKYTAEAKREVMAQLRTQDSPWTLLKRFGQSAFSGQSAEAAARLLAALDNIGIVLVRVGELENFAPTLAVSKGPEWLTAALRVEAHRGQPVRDHIKRCLSVNEM